VTEKRKKLILTFIAIIGLAPLIFMGIPSPDYSAPHGRIVGQVIDNRGNPVADIPVAQFDSDTLELVELTDSDEKGNFAFQSAPELFNLFAQPDESTNLTGQWLFDLTKNHATLLIVLEPGRPVTIKAVDENGRPVAGAQVRVYNAIEGVSGAASLKTQKITDASGEASFLSPIRAHIGVLAHDKGLLPRWLWRRSIPVKGANYSFKLVNGKVLSGRVLSQDLNPVSTAVISSWGYDSGWQWNGFVRPRSDGSFDMLAGKYFKIHVADSSRNYISCNRTFRTKDKTVLPDIILPKGAPLQVKCKGPSEEGVSSQVWFYSYENRSWSFGGYTDKNGVLNGFVSASYGVKVRPKSKGYFGANMGSQVYNSENIEVRIKEAQPVVVKATMKTTGAPIPNLYIKGYGDSWVYGGRGYTDENGEVAMRMPKEGVGRFYAKCCEENSMVSPGWYNVDLSSFGTMVELKLNSSAMISGQIQSLDGQPVDEDLLVYSYNADKWALTGKTVAVNGLFSIPVSDRYHLLVRRMTEDSRICSVNQWWNTSPSTGVHSRSPIMVTKGWFGDIQVLSKETDLPVTGVRITGGTPSRFTDKTGWATKMLLRPVYQMRNYPPPISSMNPDPVIPDLNRNFRPILRDRTLDENFPLRPFKVFTETGTVASGKVVGLQSNGMIGPIPGIQVHTYGGRRKLGTAWTDGNGEYSILAVRNTPEFGFKTSLLYWPSRYAPFLPGYQSNLELTNNAITGNYLGEIELNSAAFGKGIVTDPFGSPIKDRQVFYYTRRKDNGPSFRLGGGRLDDEGGFNTKIAPKTWFCFRTKFWDGRWENKHYTDDFSYSQSDMINLGDVMLGKTALIELRAISCRKDATESASPISSIYVDVVDAETDKVFDWRRTDSTGHVQLHAPYNRSLKLRFQFFTYSYQMGGVGFDKQTSKLFRPQESEAFTLTADKTDFGDIYITSKLFDVMEHLIKFMDSSRVDIFSSPEIKKNLSVITWLAAITTSNVSKELDTPTAKLLLENGIDLMNLALGIIEYGVINKDAKDDAERIINHAVYHFGLLYDSLED